MRLGNISVFVANVSETVSFYERAFGVPLRYMHPTGGYAELETGQCLLSFTGEKFLESAKLLGDYRFQLNRPAADPIGALVAFIADNLEADYQRALLAGAEAVSAPDPKPWGQTVAYVRDLNGFLVELCTPPIR